MADGNQVQICVLGLVVKRAVAGEARHSEGSSSGAPIALGGPATERFGDGTHLFNLKEGVYGKAISWSLDCGGQTSSHRF